MMDFRYGVDAMLEETGVILRNTQVPRRKVLKIVRKIAQKAFCTVHAE